MSYVFVNQEGNPMWVVEHRIGPDPEGSTAYEIPSGTSITDLYFKDDEIKFYTQEQLALKNQIPNYPAKWNNDLMAWVDQRTLSDAKMERNQCINTWWVNANATFFAYAGKEFATDPLSRGNIDGINGYVTLMNDFPPNWSGVWKANDNTTIEMIDVEVWKEFYAAMVAQGNNNFIHAQELKILLNDAQTIAEVEAIVW